MKLAPETERCFRERPAELLAEQIEEIRSYARFHPTRFISFVKHFLKSVRKPADVEHFSFLLERFPKQMAEVAPFMKHQINRVFFTLERLRFYREIAKSAWILEECGDVRMLELMSDLLQRPQVIRYLKSVDVYRYKRAHYLLSQRFDGKGDVAESIDLPLEKPDLRWIEEATVDGRAL
jgi:hypothetical protein